METREAQLTVTLGMLACANVVVGPPNKDGRPTTKVTKKGLGRIFWKRGAWHVRLLKWSPQPMVSVALQDSESGKTVLALLTGNYGDEFSEEPPKDVFIRAPKFQPVVMRMDERYKEIIVAVWEHADAETEAQARKMKPPTKARVGFRIVIHAGAA